MTFDELRLFRNLAGTLHFGRAAGVSHISPSALSRTIQRLEEELGCRLFQRDKRFVALTPAGETFAAYVQETLDGHDEMRRRLSEEEQTVQGEVSLFCSVTAVQSLLNSILPVFRERYSQVNIHIHTGDSADAIDRVLDGTVDISIAARPDSLVTGLEFHELARTPLVFIAPRSGGAAAEFARWVMTRQGGTGGGGVFSPSDRSGSGPSIEVIHRLKEIPFILADRALSRRAADRWFRSMGLQPRIYAEAAGHEAIIAMVRLGFGLGVVPQLVLDQSPHSGSIRIVDLQPPLPEYHIGICAQRRRLASRAVAAFWQVGVETGAFERSPDR
jgi:LysR family transcriptional regulator, positive regulator for ilvC